MSGADAKPVVLVVDDSPENLHVVGELLMPHYLVRIANSGMRALQLVEQAPLPDLILLDIMMPAMDGYAVLARLRATPAVCDIPVIFLTAMDTSADEEKGLRLGAVDYITKPVLPAILLARVNTHIDLHRARRQLQDHAATLEQRVAERTRELELALAAAERASRAKSEFLANISHELRTPMHGILGALDLLAGTGLSAEQGELATLARGGAATLLHQLNDIIDFAATETGTLRDVAEPFALADLFAELASHHDAQAREKRLDLRFAIDPALPPILVGDAARLKQILGKLVDNALKFTVNGGVGVAASLTAQDAGVIRLRCEVADSGPGIPPAQADSLFQPFTQGDASLTRSHGGTGLGLALAARLTELLGGRIGHVPAPGGGALFWFELPLRLPV